jgi:hypothetical protein
MDSREYGRIMIAFVVGAVVGIGGTLLLGRVSDLVSGAGDPLASVSQVSNKLPNLVTPSVVFTRLDRATEATWDMGLFSDRVKLFGGKSIAGSAERIRVEAELPPVAGGDVRGVFTNLLDEASVRENGALYMIWFARSDLARDFLMAQPEVFSDESLERKRDTYWAGSFAVFYAPGDVDQTDGLRTLMKEVVLCSNSLGECNIPADVKAFDAWAPRAGG